jgi:hypothetical protein
LFTRIVNQAKLCVFNASIKYMYSYEAPRNYNNAMLLDEKNGKNLWIDAVPMEFQQIVDYQTFEEKGHHRKVIPPIGHKKICVNFVFDVKHDGRHKARLVADVHLTDVPLDPVYSGFVGINGFRLDIFLADLSNLELWATDVGSVHL